MTISIRTLQQFLAVAEELHFSAAAKRLNIAQPALSRTIRELEREIGAELFMRSTRKVELTQAGRMFEPDARKTIEHLDLAIHHARKAAEGEAGTLTIGYMDFAIEGEFPTILREYRSLYPAVTVEARASHTERILSDLLERRIDVGFVVGPVSDPALASCLIQEDQFVAVVPDGHALAKKARIKLSDFAREPLVLGRRESWLPYLQRVEALCRKAGFSPWIVQEADTTESIFAFVASGIGSTLYVERAFNYNPPGVQVRLLEDVRSTIHTEAAWRTDEENPLIRNLVTLCWSASARRG